MLIVEADVLQPGWGNMMVWLSLCWVRRLRDCSCKRQAAGVGGAALGVELTLEVMASDANAE